MAWYKRVRSSRLRAPFHLAALVWLWPVPVWAQAELGDAAPSGVATTSSSSPRPPAPPVDDETETQKARARAHFQRGVTLFNQGENQAALDEFRAADAIVSHPSVWYNIGLVLTAMSRPIEALEAFDAVLAAPEVDASLLGNARQRHEQLLGHVGTLELNAAVAGALVRVDDVERGHTPLSRPLRLVQGRHVVEVLDTGHQAWRRELTVPARGQIVLDVVMQPRPTPVATSVPTPLDVAPAIADEPPNRWRRPATYGALVLGGVGLGLGAVAVVVGRSQCPDAGCPPHADDANAGAYDTWRTTAIVSAIGGVVFGAAGIALLLTAPEQPSSPRVAIGVSSNHVHARFAF